MKPELLAPAGGMETLKAAILAGCDAVYIGGKFFGARSYAPNFSDEEMIEAIRYAHLYGVKVYVTMNTIVYENEIDAFLKYAKFLNENNVDAIIIQDIGMADLLRKVLPSLKLHASTQMHIHNIEGLKLVESLGFERAVIARETPIELIKEMKKGTNLEIEVFVQGALCVSYSGQCFMSTLQSGRSGNRGTCSQCCRMPYSLYDNDKKVSSGYLLSPKDLNLLPYLEDLFKTNISSLKIEGRMKRKEYVYTVVKMYRKAIDSYFDKGYIEIDDKEMLDLQKLFNRGFTKGFINNELSKDWIHPIRPNHMGIEIGKILSQEKEKVIVKLTHPLRRMDGIRILSDKDPGLTLLKLYKNNKEVNEANSGDIVSFYIKDKVNVGDKVLLTTDSKQINDLENILKEDKKIAISMNVIVKENDFITLEVSDGKNKIKVLSDKKTEKAINSETSIERILTQVKKCGATSFVVNDIKYHIDKNIFVSIKELNELRRVALEKLAEKRIYDLPLDIGTYDIDIPDFKKENKKVLFIYSYEDYLKYKEDYDEFIVDNEELYDKIKDNVVLKLPRVNEYLSKNERKVLIGELGSAYLYKDGYSDFSLNVTNSYTVAFMHSIGIKRVTLSYELNDFQIKSLIDGYIKRYNKHPNVEVIISCTPEEMVLKYDLLKTNGIDKNICYLKDYEGHIHPVLKNNDLTTIYHFNRTYKQNPHDYYKMGVNAIRYEVKRF